MNTANYNLLPFQFSIFDKDNYILVNESGEFIFLSKNDFYELINNNLPSNSTSYNDLKSSHFIYTDHLPETIEMISAKYRTRKRFISDFTALHMMVITLKCSNSCLYCQVAAENDNAKDYDMLPETAKRIVDYIFKSPSMSIKIEFQGGEPTLNWETLKETVLYAKKINKIFKKKLDFVVCTNLVKVNTQQIEFFKEHDVHISTSIDGPSDIHDKNRILRNGNGTYNYVVKNLHNALNMLSSNYINALMTTTNYNINRLEEVILEYVRLGFNGIFIRSLNPYGLAAKNAKEIGYSAEEFVLSFEKALDFIIQLNLNGTRFVEFYTNLLLTRILTPFCTGFVDLQSPSGAGISGAIYDYNGDVFPSDEARMLSRMGNRRFFLGNVFKDSYENIFGGELIREIVGKSCLEVMPYCSSCVYQAYCGSDPIRNYLETGDIVGKRPDSYFCKKNKLIFNMLFKKLKRGDPDELDVFWSWISCKNLEEIRREKK